MQKADIIEKYWIEYLIWCAEMPEDSNTVLFKWLNLKEPTEINFWKYIVEIKKAKFAE
jgi:hypothetical protein